MDSQRATRLTSLAVRGLAIAALLAVPLTLVARFHYLPFDDCLWHAAKAVSGRGWDEILVLRPEVTLDRHPGWHALLSAAHWALGGDAALLAVLSYLALFLLATLAPIPALRRPEAWLGALLVAAAASPENLMHRLTRGRPYLVSMAALLLVLPLWDEQRWRKRSTWVASALLVAASVWIHGSWYLWVIPAAALALAGRFRRAAAFSACAAAGALLGACLTGHPLRYLYEQAQHAALSLGQGNLTRMLVGEFQPYSDFFEVLVALALVLFARRLVTGAWRTRDAEGYLLALAGIGWVCGMQVYRFWGEWGLPAVLLWTAYALEDILEHLVQEGSRRRLLFAAGLSVALWSATTADFNGRYSGGLSAAPAGLSAAGESAFASPAPARDARGWLPEPGGVVYSSNMDVFVWLFYEHPRGPWRYAYGYEAGLMTAANLEVLRGIQRDYGAWEAWQPWLEAMKPQDRLVVVAAKQPPLDQLEWARWSHGMWIGRRPAPAP